MAERRVRGEQSESAVFLPGRPGLKVGHRQQAISRNAFVRHYTEELARRQPGILHQHLEIITRGKALPRFPRAYRGNGDAQIVSNFLKRNPAFAAPIAESRGKAGANVAVERWVPGHGRSLTQLHLHEKKIRGKPKFQWS